MKSVISFHVSLIVSLHKKKCSLIVQYRLDYDIATKSLSAKRRSPIVFIEDQVAIVADLIQEMVILWSSLRVKEPDARSGNMTPNLTIKVKYSQIN